MLKRVRSCSFSSSSSGQGKPMATRTASDAIDDSDSHQMDKYRHVDTVQHLPTFIHCGLPPHTLLSFSSYDEYDIHYRQVHVNRCVECDKNFPTEHFLDLHIAENHDPLTAARKDRGEKTLACFVEGCDKVCSIWQKRRMHLVDKHMFPRNYDFFIVKDGLNGRNSLLRPEHTERRASSTSASVSSGKSSGAITVVSSDQSGRRLVRRSAPSTEAHSPPHLAQGTDDKVDSDGCQVEELTQALSSLKFVPQSIRFGRRRGRKGFAPR